MAQQRFSRGDRVYLPHTDTRGTVYQVYADHLRDGMGNIMATTYRYDIEPDYGGPVIPGVYHGIEPLDDDE